MVEVRGAAAQEIESDLNAMRSLVSFRVLDTEDCGMRVETSFWVSKNDGPGDEVIVVIYVSREELFEKSRALETIVTRSAQALARYIVAGIPPDFH